MADIDLDFSILKPEYIDAAVNNKLDGQTFSNRIWQNKANMIDKLQGSILDAMQGNTTIDKVGKDIQQTFNVSAYESQRLATTELTRVQAQASQDIATNTGLTKHMWSATLDTHTCEECAELDGKIFDIDDDSSPEMPLHPLDRCCWINVPFDGWQPSVRKDNMTKDIIDYQDYNNWLSDIGDVESKNHGSKIDITDIAIDKVPIVDIIGFDDNQNKLLQQKHQKLLKIAQGDNDSNEVLNVLTTDFYNEAMTLGSQNGVDPGGNPQAVALMRTATENSVGWIHNHPGGSTFSYTDIGQFLKPQLKFITIVTNQGKVFVLDKKDSFNFAGIYAKIKEIKNKYGGTVTNENHDLIVNDILKMITKYGVKYIK
ncbi:minor capsid protein [Clostridium guangxiense]|uniref:minor capsid protein n=1 Tax=Clostridium guangxiense TaxID=1662055 RepID=UPI001E3A6448|nr:minor capsid protein [Clostridium guangxiense]MCD2345808.1 minor capsid protein [Clostridium guangxiense]